MAINLADKLTAKTTEGIIADSKEVFYDDAMGSASSGNTVAAKISELDWNDVKMEELEIPESGETTTVIDADFSTVAMKDGNGNILSEMSTLAIGSVQHQDASETVRDIDASYQEIFNANEASRQATFNSKEATRDAANQAALDAADTLSGLTEDVADLSQKVGKISGDVETLSGVVETHEGKLSELESRFEIGRKEVSSSSNIPSAYIDTKGRKISTDSRFVVYLYKVEPNKVYYINNALKSGASACFAEYRSNDISDATATYVGPAVTSEMEEYIEKKTESDTQYIAIPTYENSGHSVFGVENINLKDLNDNVSNAKVTANIALEKSTEVSEKFEIVDDVAFEKYITGYILANGNVGELGSMRIYLYPVEPNKTYYLHSSLKQGASMWFAEYSSINPSSSTAITVGKGVTVDREDVVPFTTHDNAAYIGIAYYNNSEHSVKATSMIDLKKINEDIKGVTSLVESSNKTCAYFDGELLSIAYLNSDGKEYTYLFKKCLFNELFTFYRVGIRDVMRTNADTDGIAETASGISLLNNAFSDNIGPLSMVSGGWTGGNHSYANDGKTKTARTESYKCYADGKEMPLDKKLYCNHVTIVVNNTLFDPSVEPLSGATILNTKLADVVEVYDVFRNTIQVSVSNRFVTTSNKLAAYYGMQSMFVDETHVMTPNGQYQEWTEVANVSSFTKSAFPKFNRFIEKNNIGMQATYLIPNKLGAHENVSSLIFQRGSGKDYHFVVNGSSIEVSKKTLSCSGMYSFFCSPIVDNDNVFAYEGVVNGKRAIFVSTKQAFSGNVDMPKDCAFAKMSIVEAEGIETNNTMIDADGINISASGAGSLIFTLIG